MNAQWVGLSLAGIMGLVIVLSPRSLSSQSPPSPISTPAPTPAPTVTPSQLSSPTRLTITVSVVQPEDLKVKEGQQIQAGDLIADRGREPNRLEVLKAPLRLTLQRFKTATITPPLPSAPVPAIADGGGCVLKKPYRTCSFGYSLSFRIYLRLT